MLRAKLLKTILLIQLKYQILRRRNNPGFRNILKSNNNSALFTIQKVIKRYFEGSEAEPAALLASVPKVLVSNPGGDWTLYWSHNPLVCSSIRSW